jgi:hypothetical protein
MPSFVAGDSMSASTLSIAGNPAPSRSTLPSPFLSNIYEGHFFPDSPYFTRQFPSLGVKNQNAAAQAITQVITTITSPPSGGSGPSGYTTGSVIFAGPVGTLIEDNSVFFWDDANRRLGIGTSVPAYNIDVIGAIRASTQLISAVATGTAPLVVASTTKVTNLNAELINGTKVTNTAAIGQVCVGTGAGTASWQAFTSSSNWVRPFLTMGA